MFEKMSHPKTYRVLIRLLIHITFCSIVTAGYNETINSIELRSNKVMLGYLDFIDYNLNLYETHYYSTHYIKINYSSLVINTN